MFLTATIAHTSTTPASEQLQRFATVWSNLSRGRAYAALRKKYALAASYRTAEATWTVQEGFHVHHHLIVILDSDAQVEAFRNDWLALWCGTAKKLGFYASPSAQDVRPVERSEARVAAQYLTKLRFPVNALERAAQGDAAAARAWTEWCAAVADLRTRSTQPTGVLRDWNKRAPAPKVIEEVQVNAEVALVMQEADPALIDAVTETLRVRGAVAAVELLRLHGYPAKAIVHRRTVWGRLRDLLSRRRPPS
ncbi:hypothetical protein [Rathayibacter sp. VKM Ac-2927]|uniref:hypothetical protein n=1 Tax=Rathayibacter sp. VKM Ac-2927 TaxID=2929478 RepID=UPI001FB3469F|nr:hypothetical protein [Rathayibacter sp. VKM Ac-2927]MCJ1687870.1 hypothetical protein [Rathayibacter sp. VKM Ac-2927]